MIAKNIKENILMRCDYLSIRALHPESLVNPFPKKCVVVAQRLSTFDNAKQASLIKEATGTLEVIYWLPPASRNDYKSPPFTSAPWSTAESPPLA